MHTDPRELEKADDPVGPDNKDFLVGPLYHPVVVGWGAAVPRIKQSKDMIASVTGRAITEQGKWFCLGHNKDLSPKHPLMLSYKTERQLWP